MFGSLTSLQWVIFVSTDALLYKLVEMMCLLKTSKLPSGIYGWLTSFRPKWLVDPYTILIAG